MRLFVRHLTCVVAVLVILVPCALNAEEKDKTKASIDAYFDNIFQDFVGATYVGSCTAVVYGTVVAVETEPYSSIPGADEDKPRWHVGTRMTIQVEKSWKHALSGTIEVWTHGGVLPVAHKSEFDPWPRGCGSSVDVQAKLGQPVYVTIAEDHPLRPAPIWTAAGSSGFVAADIAESGPVPAIGTAPLTPEVNAYFQAKAADFYVLLNDFLSTVNY